MRRALRRQEGGPFLLDVHDDLIPNSPTPRPAPMRKADAPRFPRPSSPSDDVRFVGVFSATYGERKDAVTLKRGETLPGFFFDLAPLATKTEHRQWIESVTTAGRVTWTVP